MHLLHRKTTLQQHLLRSRERSRRHHKTRLSVTALCRALLLEVFLFSDLLLLPLLLRACRLLVTITSAVYGKRKQLCICGNPLVESERGHFQRDRTEINEAVSRGERLICLQKIDWNKREVVKRKRKKRKRKCVCVAGNVLRERIGTRTCVLQHARINAKSTRPCFLYSHNEVYEHTPLCM